MRGGFPPADPLSTMEQMLLLGCALFCALVWRCLARSMESRAREREERKRRRRETFNSEPAAGWGLKQEENAKRKLAVALGGRPPRSRSATESYQQPPSMFGLKRTSSAPQAAAVDPWNSSPNAQVHPGCVHTAAFSQLKTRARTCAPQLNANSR